MTDSKANFVFVEHERLAAAEIAAALRERGVIVRHLANHPTTVNRLRISIGSESECEALVAALREII
jgi:histidinol-phosphate aminotransferase